jgi:(4S)-4-hydroxy-5-phosphonooxypentane-2,3-dione isomerase
MSDSPFTVLAEFSVPAENRAEFLEACAYDSRHSVADEPGCQQFDALTDPEAPDSVVLYEVYDDQAAFDAHLQTPHYAVFDAAVQRLGVTKVRVRFLSLQPV